MKNRIVCRKILKGVGRQVERGETQVRGQAPGGEASLKRDTLQWGGRRRNKPAHSQVVVPTGGIGEGGTRHKAGCPSVERCFPGESRENTGLVVVCDRGRMKGTVASLGGIGGQAQLRRGT